MENKGVDKFLKSSDDFFGRVANFLDQQLVNSDQEVDASQLKDICDIVKITAMSIKSLREEEKEKKPSTPFEKQKNRAKGSQVAV